MVLLVRVVLTHLCRGNPRVLFIIPPVHDLCYGLQITFMCLFNSEYKYKATQDDSLLTEYSGSHGEYFSF